MRYKEIIKLIEDIATNSHTTIINNPKFKSWFKGSKCVDNSGLPLRMFHGTMNGVEQMAVKAGPGWLGDMDIRPYVAGTEAITHFDPEHGVSAMNSINQKAGNGQSASYFTSNPRYAAQYGSAIYPVYLWIGKLYVAKSYNDICDMNPTKVGQLKLQGYDGAMYNSDGKSDEWCIWSSWQVKSATGNTEFTNSDHIGEQVMYESSVNVDGRTIPINLSNQSPARLYSLVDVNISKIDAAFKLEPDFYVGVNGLGGIRNRFSRFGEFVATAPSVEAAIIDILDDGKICFVNGRHRFAWFRDYGLTHVPVALSKESIINAKKYNYIN